MLAFVVIGICFFASHIICLLSVYLMIDCYPNDVVQCIDDCDNGDGRLLYTLLPVGLYITSMTGGNGDGRLLYTLLPVGLYITLMTVVMEMVDFQIGAGLYAVGRPVQKRNDEDGQIGTIQSLPLERGALFNRFFGEPAHGPPHVAGGASGPIGGCRDESRTDNPHLDLRHVFDRNNRKTDLI